MLGVSTALITEVREEVVDATRREPRIELTPPDSGAPGLPIREFTLLDPAIGALSDHRSQGNTLLLDGPGRVDLETGDTIRVSPIPLLQDATLTFLTEGTHRPGELVCDGGCLIESGEQQLAAPSETRVLLGQDDQVDLPMGPVPAGTTAEVPAGGQVTLAPITMHAPTQVPLGAGSTIVFPGAIPIEDASITPQELELPVNTLVRGAANGSIDPDALGDLLADGTRAGGQGVDRASSRTAKPVINVTHVPDAIEKGRPFQVRGTVHLPDGEPSQGHPITLFANRTKQRPGFEINLGNVETGPDGRFDATARIETHRPTQPYHIVARAHPVPDGDPPLREAWSDPIVGVRSDARLELDLPEVAGIRVPLALQARLVDEHGAPIPGQTVHLHIQGTPHRFAETTDDTGQAFAVLNDGLPFPGNWTVDAWFDGTDHIASARATDHIEAVEARIEAHPTLVVARGTQAAIEGTVIVDGKPASKMTVASAYEGGTSSARTAEDGTFRLTFEVPGTLEVGNYTLELRTDEIGAQHNVVLTVTAQTILETPPLDPAPLGGTLPLEVHATTEQGGSLAGLQVVATTPSGERSQGITDEQGRVELGIPLTQEGSWELRLSTPGNSLVTRDTRTVPIETGHLTIGSPLVATAGRTSELNVTLAVGDQPLANQPVTLRGPGFTASAVTDKEGGAQTTLTLPESLEPGEHDIELDLPGYNLLESHPLQVRDRPSLEVQVLEPGTDGAPVRLAIQATGLSGGALSGIPLSIEADGAFTATEHARTAADGSALVTIERPGSAEGLVELRVRALATETTGDVTEIASAQLTPAPFPWWTLGVLLALALAAGGVLWARRERQDRPAPPGPAISLAIGPQGHTLPPVWHSGAPTKLHIELHDEHGRPLPGRDVTVTGPHGTATVHLDEAGKATLAIPALEGSVTYEARFDGDGDRRPARASLELRLVDYREEIDREYRDLLETSTKQGLCGPDATPHELARALGGSRPATRLAQLFEVCDYSQRPVNRSHYVKFMKAKEACRPHGGPRPG